MPAYPFLVKSSAFATNVAGFTASSHVLVAAPGAGLTHRVLRFSLTKWVTVGGVGPDVLCWLNPGATGLGPVDFILGVDLRANVQAEALIPDPGYAYGDNVALTVGSVSTIASAEFFVSVAYYTTAT